MPLEEVILHGGPKPLRTRVFVSGVGGPSAELVREVPPHAFSGPGKFLQETHIRNIPTKDRNDQAWSWRMPLQK